MDLLTHALLGATVAAAVAPAPQRRLAATLGAAGALLPDLDALIRSSEDPLLVLDFHRHFTHSLLFAPFGALLLAALAWPLLRQRLAFARILLYAGCGIALSAPLDACTSYGTHLWLPFSEQRAAWNLIAVFDPLFTLLLGVALAFALYRQRSAPALLGLGLACVYLGLGWLQQQRVEHLLREVAAARGHAPQRLHAKPTLGNLVLWRGLYVADGHVYADAVHAGPRLRHYAGASAPLMGPDPAHPHAAQIERFRRFSDGWLVAGSPGLAGDARYAMLPTDIAPIWGLATDAGGRIDFVTRRAMDAGQRRRWLAMLLGRDA